MIGAKEMIMKSKNPQRAGQSSTHSRPDNPNFGTFQTPGLVEPRFNSLTGAGQSQPNLKERLQNVLPEIYALAQKVGGMKQLAELTNTLAEAKN
jgi:hypothetical protein